MHPSVLLYVHLQHFERSCCSLLKGQLLISVAETTWGILKLTWCQMPFFSGILVKTNTEATPRFLHYPSLVECLWTNSLRVWSLILHLRKLWVTLSELTGAKARIFIAKLTPSSLFYVNEKSYNISFTLAAPIHPCSWEEIPEYSHLTSLTETPRKGLQLNSPSADHQLPTHSMLFFSE